MIGRRIVSRMSPRTGAKSLPSTWTRRRTKESSLDLVEPSSKEYLIPPTFHFFALIDTPQPEDASPLVYCMSKMLGDNKEWHLMYYLAVASALKANPGYCAIIHCDKEPSGKWWEETVKLPNVVVDKIVPPSEIYGRPLYYNGQKVNVLRLQHLLKEGGISLDLDTLVLGGLNELRSHKFVMSKEGSRGLAGSMMLSSKGSVFVDRWLYEYHGYKGSRDGRTYWGNDSILLPLLLSQLPTLESEITVLSSSVLRCIYNSERVLFFGDKSSRRFNRFLSFDKTKVLHFGQAAAFEVVSQITEDWVRTSESQYAKLTRELLP